MSKTRCLLVALALFVSQAHAASDETLLTDWQADCALGDHRFSVHFHTDSADVTDDDMQATLVLPDQQRIQLPLPPAWYHQVSTTSSLRSLCDRLVATSAGQQRVLLWLASDDRPSYSQLNLLLIDLKDGRVLDKRLRLGAIKSDTGGIRLTLRHQNKSKNVRLVRETLTNTDDDTANNYIEDWMRVTVRNNKLETGWLRAH